MASTSQEPSSFSRRILEQQIEPGYTLTGGDLQQLRQWAAQQKPRMHPPSARLPTPIAPVALPQWLRDGSPRPQSSTAGGRDPYKQPVAALPPKLSPRAMSAAASSKRAVAGKRGEVFSGLPAWWYFDPQLLSGALERLPSGSGFSPAPPMTRPAYSSSPRPSGSGRRSQARPQQPSRPSTSSTPRRTGHARPRPATATVGAAPPPPRRKQLGDDALASWQVQRKLANGQLLTADEMELLRAQAEAEAEAEAEVEVGLGAEAPAVAPLAPLPARGTVEAARLSALRVKADRGLLLSAAELDMLRQLSASGAGASGGGGDGDGGGGAIEEHDASVAAEGEQEGGLRGGDEASLLLDKKLEAEHLPSAEEWAMPRADEGGATDTVGASWHAAGGVEVDAVPEDFAEQFWLTPRTRLTVTTPVSVLNSFCRDHGFYLRSLGTNMTPHEQRCKLRELLLLRGWPQGRSALLRAMTGPMSPRPTLPINGAAMPF